MTTETDKLVPYVTGQVAGAKKCPEWMRTAVLDTETGEIFAPAFTELVFLSALHDGERCVLHRRRPFFRTEWMKRECPLYANLAARIEKKIRSIRQAELAVA